MNERKKLRSNIFEFEVVCQICGHKSLTNIQNHIRFKHPEIKIIEYMNKYDAEIMSEEAKRQRANKVKGKNVGKVRTEEEKAHNSEKMKQFWKDNPEKRQEQVNRQKEKYDRGEHPLFREDVVQGRRDRMTEMNKSEEHRTLVGNHMKNVYVCSDETKKKMSLNFTGRKHTEETKILMSKKALLTFINGRKAPGARIRGTYVSTKTNQICNYMSSYELIFMKKLDNDVEVKTWVYEPFSIPYLFNEEIHSYFPDVLIDNHNLVEIKSKYFWFKHKEICAAKAEAAREYCEERGWEYRILYEDDLGIEANNYPDYIKNFNFPRC